MGSTTLGFDQIVSIYEPENVASARIMERIGMAVDRDTLRAPASRGPGERAWDVGGRDRRDQRVDVTATAEPGQERRLRLAVQDVVIDTALLAHGGQCGDRGGTWPARHPRIVPSRLRSRRPTIGVRGRRQSGRAGLRPRARSRVGTGPRKTAPEGGRSVRI